MWMPVKCLDLSPGLWCKIFTWDWLGLGVGNGGVGWVAVSFNGPRQDEIGYNRRVNLAISNQMGVKLLPKWGPEEGKMYSIIWSFLLLLQNVLFFLKGQGNMIFFILFKVGVHLIQ